MYREYFAHHPMLALPVLSLALFMALFAMIVARALRAPRHEMDDLAALPLECDREESPCHLTL